MTVNKKCRKCLLVTSVLMMSISLVVITLGSDLILDSMLHSAMQITEGKEAYDMWMDLPVDIFLNIYLFNITNPESFSKGDKPNLQELGPYVYQEYHRKVNIVPHSNGTITFQQQKWWIFREEKSNAKLSDPVATFNTIPATVASLLENKEHVLFGLNNLFNLIGEESLIVKEAGEIIFDGYQDPLLSYLNKSKNFGGDMSIINLIDSPTELLNYDRFAWFYLRNNSETYDGIFNMYTGEDSINNFGKIDRWNHMRFTEYFDGEKCNEIDGSAGELWPPRQERTHIKLFSPDLCMTMKIPYLKDVKDSYGIEGYRYYGNAETFEEKEENCYCVHSQCAPKGLINSQSCKFGAPVFISYPHFLYAEEISENSTVETPLINDVVGMNPNPDKHMFYLDLNPDLGTPIEVAARMQINVKVKPYKGSKPLRLGKIDILKDYPEVILPMMWFEMFIGINEQFASEMKPVLFIMSTQFLTIVFSIFALASALTIIFILLTRKTKDLISYTN